MTEEQLARIQDEEDRAFVEMMRRQIEYILSYQTYKLLPDGGRFAAQAMAKYASSRRR